MSARVASFARQTVAVQRAAVTVDHGNTVRDWTTPVTTVVGGCVLAPQKGTEDNVNRDGTVTPWLLVAPAGTDIDHGDRVLHGARVLEVVGPARDWRTGVVDHVEADLAEVAG